VKCPEPCECQKGSSTSSSALDRPANYDFLLCFSPASLATISAMALASWKESLKRPNTVDVTDGERCSGERLENTFGTLNRVGMVVALWCRIAAGIAFIFFLHGIVGRDSLELGARPALSNDLSCKRF
jgi:hypothetical protein